MNRRIEWLPTHLPTPFPSPFKQDGTHRIPNRLYSDAELHVRELEAFFYKAH